MPSHQLENDFHLFFFLFAFAMRNYCDARKLGYEKKANKRK